MSIFNRYKGHDSLFFDSKCSGVIIIIISYMEANAIFCTRIDFTKIIVMSLDFVDVINKESISKRMAYRTH